MENFQNQGSYSELQVANRGGVSPENAPVFSEQTQTYLDSLEPEERQKAIERINAPLTGEDIAEALKRDMDYVPTQPDYLKYLAYNKTHETSLLDGIAEGAGTVLGDLSRAVGAVADHPMKALATAPTSLIEAFAQGTRNLYGMVAQSANPDSVLFGLKDAISGNGSDEGYRQFLEARKFNKHSAALASGDETIIMDKRVIDHDTTLAMSYIADPTLFIPFGQAATAGMRVVGMGEKMVMLGARAQALKSAVIGGGLKWGIGVPIEAIGATTKGVIDKAIAVGGNVLETTTGMSAKEFQATARMSAVGTSTASVLGGHIPVVSTISNVYIGAGAARGFGEAIGAVGEQIQKQGFKRGYNSFAREALEQTPNLSPHAKGLLKVLDAVDPLMSYGYGMAEGIAVGSAVGGGLGYLSGGKEGLGHGIGAGMALGGTGALAGRMFADISGGTKMARAEVQGGFVVENMRADNHPNLPAVEAVLLRGTLAGDRAGALQVIAGLDRIAPDMRLIVETAKGQEAILKAKGLDADGHRVDPKTGKKVLDAQGKPIQFEAPMEGFYGGEGFTMVTDKDGNGKKQVTVVINADSTSKNVLHHELFHAVFKTTVMERMFRDGFAEAILGKFDSNGIKVKASEIDPKEFRAFVQREFQYTVDPTTGKKFKDLPPSVMAQKMAEFDAHLAEYQKAGSTAKMNPDSARVLDNLVEEFGAHYATQFMKGKPVDYLFRGAEYTGMQGVMDRLHNNFLDFWQSQVTRQNPTFGDFSKGFDASFGPNKGNRTLAQRSSAIDYMVQDLLRSVAGKRKGSTNSFDVRTLSPEARTAFFDSNGMDGVKAYYDKDGKLRNITEAQIEAERVVTGKAIHDSLSKLDPAVINGLKDLDGNFNVSSTTGTRFNDTVLAHLVKEGHISQLLADRIRDVQDIVAGKGSNVVSYLYKGASMETQVGPNSPRLRGAAVPITARETIVVGYEIKVKKDGTMSFLMKGLDKKVIDERGNKLWADQTVRDLWQGDRTEFEKSFFDYLSNASKASTDKTRLESSLIPSLARGDGFGGERRNVMHQFLGMAKRKAEAYFNTPIAEIPRGKTSTVTNFTMDTMSPMKSNTSIRYDFNLDNAHRDLSKNFKVSDMDAETTTNGTIFTHASGYKITSDANGASKLYDSNGNALGEFKNKELASNAMEKAYASERVEIEKRIERVKEYQDKQQMSFKVWDDETLAEGRRLGDIFATDAGKAFTHGTELIRQTREEFYSDNFIKLRQSDPETAMQVTEQVVQRGYALRDLRTKAYDRLQIAKDRATARGEGFKNAEYKAAAMDYETVVAHADRYNDVILAYERATARGNRNGQAILDYINKHRRTSVGYDNMAKVFFGEQYDNQFQTGKPVTTVATHGTNSAELMTSREFDPKQLGTRHGSQKDKIGVFLAGETKTSFGYADPKAGDTGYRQVRAAIKFNNPFVFDYKFECFAEYKYEKIFDKARADGHDGIIIKNVYDGGNADTVFIVMADSIKDNTAIIDTHIGMEKVFTKSEKETGMLESDQGSIRYPIQESMPRGEGVRVGTGVGISWKVADGVARETGFDKFLEGAELSGRLRKDVDSSEFAGRPVVLINYDNSGVWNLIDSSNGKVISKIQGGALHNVISGEINPDKQSAVLASVNSAGLKGIESVRQKAIKSGKPLTFLLISGNETKSFSHPQVGGAVTSLLAKFVQSKAINPKEIDVLIRAMSEAFSTKTVKNKDGTTSQIRVPQGDLLKPMIGKSAAEQIAFLEKQFFPQDKSTFNNRGETMDRLVQTLATLPSVIKNKDYFQKFFNNPEMKITGKDFAREILKLTDEPITRGADGESLGYGKIVAALEVPQKQTMVTETGGHEGFPMDYRSDAGGGKTTPAVMSVFKVPRRITDMINPPHGKDVSTHYLSKSGKFRSTSELLMNTTSTFGEGVVRESSHEMRKDTLNKATTKEKTLAGEPKFKVSDIAGEPLDGGRTYDTGSEQWKRGFVGRIAEQNPEKFAGIEINYIENKRLIKGQNLITVALHNDSGQQVGILNATIYSDGTAKIVDTQVPEQFGNRGYSKLMLSEFGERVRSQGVKEVYGEVVDKLDRPTKARRSAFGNAELDPESFSNISESGKVTVSRLNPEARYKVSDADIARVQERVDMLQSIIDKNERFKKGGKGYSDQKRRYWDAKSEHYSLVEYTLKPMLAEKQKETTPPIKPFEGNYKVSDSVKTGVKQVADMVDKLSDTANLSPTIKTAVEELRLAVRKQDATDEVLVPELRASYDKIVSAVEEGIARPSLTPVETLKGLQKILKPLDKNIEKNSQRISKNAKKAYEADMAEGADVEARQSQSARAESQRDMAEGADIEAEQIQATRAENQRTLDEGADVEAEGIKKVRSQSQATHRRDMAEGTAIESEQAIQDRANNRSDMEEGANMDREQFLQRDLTEGEQLDAAEIPRPRVKPPAPTPPPAPVFPSSTMPPDLGGGYATPFRSTPPPVSPIGKLEGWRGWTLEKGLNGGFWKNAVGWMIIVQGDKYKVYNPQKAMLGIYLDLDQAKRRVQREEPKK